MWPWPTLFLAALTAMLAVAVVASNSTSRRLRKALRGETTEREQLRASLHTAAQREITLKEQIDVKDAYLSSQRLVAENAAKALDLALQREKAIEGQLQEQEAELSSYRLMSDGVAISKLRQQLEALADRIVAAADRAQAIRTQSSETFEFLRSELSSTKVVELASLYDNLLKRMTSSDNAAAERVEQLVACLDGISLIHQLAHLIPDGGQDLNETIEISEVIAIVSRKRSDLALEERQRRGQRHEYEQSLKMRDRLSYLERDERRQHSVETALAFSSDRRALSSLDKFRSIRSKGHSDQFGRP